MGYPLLWCDFETTELPNGLDFSNVHILEVAAIVTDQDLELYGGFHEAIKLTKAGADSLRGNEVVKKMHTKNGLIKDAIASTVTVADAEQEILQLLSDKTAYDKGQFTLAGSGVTAFDHPLIKAKMPELASWLTYYSLDVGNFRRALSILGPNGHTFVQAPKTSYDQNVKTHRALEDVKAHIEEAKLYQKWLKSDFPKFQ